MISLDYHHTLQVTAGNQAEEAHRQTMRDYWGRYVLVVDGTISTIEDGAWSTIAGEGREYRRSVVFRLNAGQVRPEPWGAVRRRQGKSDGCIPYV